MENATLESGRKGQQQHESQEIYEQRQPRRSSRGGARTKRGLKTRRPVDALWVRALTALPTEEEGEGRWRFAFTQQTPCELCDDSGGLVVQCAKSGKVPEAGLSRV
jgi:hypothetical protein